MSFYHDDSPQADETRREVTFGQSAYLQRTSTLSFDVIYHDGERAVTLATHRHLRIAGIKFMEVRRDPLRPAPAGSCVEALVQLQPAGAPLPGSSASIRAHCDPA